jgi:hypothetical protein
MQNNGIQARTVAWSPAPTRLPSPYRALGKASLGQSGGFFESPTVNFILDSWTALAAGFLAVKFGRVGNKWSTFWYVVSATAAFKALYSLSKTEK